MKHVLPCIADLENEAELVVEGVESILKKNEKDMKEGLEKIGLALETLPEAMLECGMAVNDAKQLMSALKAVESPLQFAYHVGKDLIVNGINIYKEVNQAIADYKDQEYQDMGKQIGEVLE